MIYTSRSQHASSMQCPRKGWWEYYAPNGTGTKGWQRKLQDPALLLGGCVHIALGLMVGGVPIQTVLSAINHEFDKQVNEHGLDGDAPETRALMEAIVRAWARVRLAYWQENFEVLSIEKEEAVLIAPDVTLLARSDVVVRRKADGLVFIINWKTTASAGKQWLDGWETDMQLATETLAVQSRLGRPVAGVIVEGLLKGERRAEKDEAGNHIGWRVVSPLIYGYKFDGNPPVEPPQYRHDYTRAKGWHRFKVWEEPFSHTPVDYWVNWLPEEIVQAQFSTVPPIMRSPQQIRRKAIQIASYERRAAASAHICQTAPEHLDADFPQNEHSCHWPRRCPMYDLCWSSGVAEDPIGSGLYMPRQPNHPIPKAEFASVENG